ncbi:hypothetical protein BG74_08695 [Sodalis-like endosymbiont of Proechinophthirus fluctus]|nr:hypothetical protein BG74_08695 [Sodalis-like endosymbiont of Proechinophthirus fluctus]
MFFVLSRQQPVIHSARRSSPAADIAPRDEYRLPDLTRKLLPDAGRYPYPTVTRIALAINNLWLMI